MSTSDSKHKQFTQEEKSHVQANVLDLYKLMAITTSVSINIYQKNPQH